MVRRNFLLDQPPVDPVSLKTDEDDTSVTEMIDWAELSMGSFAFRNSTMNWDTNNFEFTDETDDENDGGDWADFSRAKPDSLNNGLQRSFEKGGKRRQGSGRQLEKDRVNAIARPLKKPSRKPSRNSSINSKPNTKIRSSSDKSAKIEDTKIDLVAKKHRKYHRKGTAPTIEEKNDLTTDRNGTGRKKRDQKKNRKGDIAVGEDKVEGKKHEKKSRNNSKGNHSKEDDIGFKKIKDRQRSCNIGSSSNDKALKSSSDSSDHGRNLLVIERGLRNRNKSTTTGRRKEASSKCEDHHNVMENKSCKESDLSKGDVLGLIQQMKELKGMISSESSPCIKNIAGSRANQTSRLGRVVSSGGLRGRKLVDYGKSVSTSTSGSKNFDWSSSTAGGSNENRKEFQKKKLLHPRSQEMMKSVFDNELCGSLISPRLLQKGSWAQQHTTTSQESQLCESLISPRILKGMLNKNTAAAGEKPQFSSTIMEMQSGNCAVSSSSNRSKGLDSIHSTGICSNKNVGVPLSRSFLDFQQDNSGTTMLSKSRSFINSATANEMMVQDSNATWGFDDPAADSIDFTTKRRSATCDRGLGMGMGYSSHSTRSSTLLRTNSFIKGEDAVGRNNNTFLSPSKSFLLDQIEGNQHCGSMSSSRNGENKKKKLHSGMSKEDILEMFLQINEKEIAEKSAAKAAANNDLSLRRQESTGKKAKRSYSSKGRLYHDIIDN